MCLRGLFFGEIGDRIVGAHQNFTDEGGVAKHGWDPTVQQAKSIIGRNLIMWNMIWPLMLIVGSNCLYNISTKSMPENANPFGALTVTYVTSALISAVVFLGGTGPAKAVTELSHVHWTSFALGLSIIGLETGYVFLYRAGWKISSGSLTANICLAIVLLFVGLLLFKETISPRQFVGVVVCGIGLFLINR